MVTFARLGENRPACWLRGTRLLILLSLMSPWNFTAGHSVVCVCVRACVCVYSVEPLCMTPPSLHESEHQYCVYAFNMWQTLHPHHVSTTHTHTHTHTHTPVPPQPLLLPGNQGHDAVSMFFHPGGDKPDRFMRTLTSTIISQSKFRHFPDRLGTHSRCITRSWRANCLQKETGKNRTNPAEQT